MSICQSMESVASFWECCSLLDERMGSERLIWRCFGCPLAVRAFSEGGGGTAWEGSVVHVIASDSASPASMTRSIDANEWRV